MNDPRSARDVPAAKIAELEAKIASHAHLAGVFCHELREWRRELRMRRRAAATNNEAKPSPREALRAIVEELEKRAADSRHEAEVNIYGTKVHDARADECREAITLIRSMAGHLMEPSE